MAIVDFDTGTWDDRWVVSLSPNAKLLFIYLWTNKHKGVTGLYKITKRQMEFDTGLVGEVLDAALKEITTPIIYPTDTLPIPPTYPTDTPSLGYKHFKVMYAPKEDVVWVVNHVFRQFMRTGQISPTIVKSIIKANNLLKQHPFVDVFKSCYSALFSPSSQAKDESVKVVSGDTLSIPPAYPLGGGKGGGKGEDGENKPENNHQGKELLDNSEYRGGEGAGEGAWSLTSAQLQVIHHRLRKEFPKLTIEQVAKAHKDAVLKVGDGKNKARNAEAFFKIVESFALHAAKVAAGVSPNPRQTNGTPPHTTAKQKYRTDRVYGPGSKTGGKGDGNG